MKVILLQDIASLGKAGEVKDVKTGYGLNFLLPEGLVELATPAALKKSEKVLGSKKSAAKATEASLAAKAEAAQGKEVAITHKEKDGKLFGSVTKSEIKEALQALGIEAAEKEIILPKPIKETGTFSATLDFGHGAKAEISVIVTGE